MRHFLQSSAWQFYQESIGNKTFRLQGEGWQVLVVESSAHGVKRLYCPYGPTLEDIARLPSALQAIEELGRKERAIFVRIEPTGLGVQDLFAEPAATELRRSGYRKVESVQPSDTWIVDLTQGEEALLKQMGSTNRNVYRGIERRGLEVVTSTNPEDARLLHSILAEVSDQNGNFQPHSEEYLFRQAKALFDADSARLYLVRHQEEVIAASLVYESDGVAYYAHSGATSANRKLRAGQALVTHMIFDAKERGFSALDLVGIAPNDDPDHPWAGFTSFKKSFGGFARHYVGTWEKPLKPVTYGLYRGGRRIDNLLREIR